MTVKKRPHKPNSRDRLKKVNHSLYLEPWQSEALAEISDKTGVPQQVYLRLGLMLVLEQWDIGHPDYFDRLVKQASKARKPFEGTISDVPTVKASKHK